MRCRHVRVRSGLLLAVGGGGGHLPPLLLPADAQRSSAGPAAAQVGCCGSEKRLFAVDLGGYFGCGTICRSWNETIRERPAIPFSYIRPSLRSTVFPHTLCLLSLLPPPPHPSLFISFTRSNAFHFDPLFIFHSMFRSLFGRCDQIVVVPILIGLLFELLLVVPMRVPMDESPLFLLYQDWALGLLFLKIWTRLVRITYIHACMPL